MSDTVKTTLSMTSKELKNKLAVNISIADIAYMVMCYVMSGCELFLERTPFALSVYAAAFGTDKWLVLFISAALGLVRFRFDFLSVVYILAMAASTFFMGFFKNNVRFRALSTSACLFVSLLCANIATEFYMYDALLAAVEAALCFGGVYVFHTAVPLILNGRERRCVFDTEIVAVYVLFALVVRCTTNMPLLLGMDLSVILAVVLLFVINMEGEVASGAAMGVVFGIVTTGRSDSMTASIGAFALASLCSGMFKRFGKWGVVLGFVLANTAMTAFLVGEVLPFDIFELIFASVIFAVLPKRITQYVSSFPAKTVHAATEAFLEQDKMQRVISEKLSGLSSSYKSLAVSYEKCFENKNMSKQYIIHMLDTASSKICPGCGLKYNCWERGYKESYKAMLDMLETAEAKGAIEVSDVPEVLSQKCIKIDNFVGAFNRMYEVYKVEKLWQQKLNESRMLVSGQLAAVGRSIDKLADEFDMCLDIAAEKELKTYLDREGMGVTDVTFLKGQGDDFAAEIVFNKWYISKKDEQRIVKIIKEVTEADTAVSSTRHLKDGIAVVFKPCNRYSVSVGNASACRNGEEVSGDSFIVCQNSYGELVAAISDGMGTGAKASVESVTATELLSSFMSAGMDVETSLELINSSLLLRSSGDSFATMDVCTVRLSDGQVRFSKSGAAPGYIKNEYGISRIDSDSLPFGVLEDYGDINTEIYTVENSALIVLMSDGVSDVFSMQSEDYVARKLEDIETVNPQIIASILLKHSLELSGGKADDDMTVLVLSVWKNR